MELDKTIKIEVKTFDTKISIQKVDNNKYILNLNDYDSGYVEYELNQIHIEELLNGLEWIKKVNYI